MDEKALRTAVVAPVLGAAPVVDAWRQRTCRVGPSDGVPPHVTLLFPFVPAAQLDPQVFAGLVEVIGSAPVLRFELGSFGRFPGVLYLEPDPEGPFVALTEALVGRFPEHVPYEGAFDAIVPHLTVAQGDETVLDEAEADVRARLPLYAVVEEALLLTEEASGRWSTRARVPLAGGW